MSLFEFSTKKQQVQPVQEFLGAEHIQPIAHNLFLPVTSTDVSRQGEDPVSEG